MRKETICWTCLNYDKCEWSFGEPVKDWTATPTVVSKNSKKPFNSFIVRKCPKYEANKELIRKERVIKKVAKIFGKSERTVYRYIYKGKIDIVNAALAKKNLKLTTKNEHFILKDLKELEK